MGTITQGATEWVETFSADETWVVPSATAASAKNEVDGAYPVLTAGTRTVVDSPWGSAFGKAQDFSSNGTYYFDSVNISLSGFCLEAKYKPDAFVNGTTYWIAGRWTGSGASSHVVIGILSSGVYGAGFVPSSGTISFISSTVTPVVGTAVDLAVTYDGATVRFFVNGTLSGTPQSVGAMLSPSASSFTIGSANGSAGADGVIDEVRYSIAPRYTSSYTPATQPFTVDSDTTGLFHLEPLGFDVTGVKSVEVYGHGGDGGEGTAVGTGGGGGGGGGGWSMVCPRTPDSSSANRTSLVLSTFTPGQTKVALGTGQVGAFDFDGTLRAENTQGVSCGNNGEGSPSVLTIDCIVTPASGFTSAIRVIAGCWIDARNGAGERFVVGTNITTGAPFIQWYDTSNIARSVVSSTGLTAGTTYHLRFHLQSANMRIYINGNVDGVDASSWRTVASPQPFTIGRTSGNPSGPNASYPFPWKGAIGELRLSNVMRLATQFDGSYTLPTQPWTSDANTIGLWHLNSITPGLTVTPGNSCRVEIGSLGVDTFFSTTANAPTSIAQGALAKFGVGGGNGSATTNGGGGAGGSAASGIGDVKFSGGNGASGSGGGGGGGGGAGPGGAGSNASGTAAGAGGSGNIGVTAGVGGTGGSAPLTGATGGGQYSGGGGGGAAIAPSAGGAPSTGLVRIRYNRIHAPNTLNSAPASDATARSFIGTRVVADSAPASDAVTRQFIASRPISESAPATDAVTRRFVGARAVSDSAPATDAVTRRTVQTRQLTDSSPATDAVTRQTTQARLISESAPASDAVTRRFVGTRQIVDSAPGSDSVTRRTIQSRSISESAPATDAATRRTTQSRSVSESAPASDSVTRRTVQFRMLAESAPASDAVTRRTVQSRSITESAPATDAATRQVNFIRTITDSSPATDAVTRVARFPRATTESAPATDAVTRQTVQSRGISDSAPATDAVTRQLNYQRFLQEGLSDYFPRFPLKSIVGVVYNHETGEPLTGMTATVKLFRDSDDFLCQTTTSSSVDGSFTFPRDMFDPYTYHYTAEFEISGVQYHGISDRGILPT